MKIKEWQPTDSAFTKSLNKTELKKLWKQLHAADLAPVPAGDLMDAWLAYHNGDFSEAVHLGRSLGIKGLPVVIRAVVAYTDYICEDDKTTERLLHLAYEYGVETSEGAHFDYNCEFTTAVAMGRYSQSISITKALHQGLGGKIKKRLATVLEHQPDHAEAHIALGLYHAEIINKVGATLGGITYGARSQSAIEHCEKGLSLAATPINLIEAGNVYILLKGEDAVAKATKLYDQAAAIEPLDCVQALDVDFAQSQL